MYKVGIVLFDDFTDVDFFLMYDLLGRSKESWSVKILGTKPEHGSALGINVKTDGHVTEARDQDVVLITSGQRGIPAALQDHEFMSALRLEPQRQLIGSICAGSFILHELGLLKGKKLTTNPAAKARLLEMGGRCSRLSPGSARKYCNGRRLPLLGLFDWLGGRTVFWSGEAQVDPVSTYSCRTNGNLRRTDIFHHQGCRECI